MKQELPNQISKKEKIIAVAALTFFILLPLVLIIGLWPDQLPEPKESQVYAYNLFDVNQVKDGVANADTIHLNTILFFLVALSGFLGSMIHLSSSLTNYIGAGQLQSNWLPWYFVKPFTAMGVALVFYFVLKAGLVGLETGVGINPFGIVVISALAGLFTDKATLKLEEIFTTIFKPQDQRPDKIDPVALEPKALG